MFKFYVIVFMWIGLLFYALYFYTLKAFFRVFIESEIFNNTSLKRLKIFFYMNLTPTIYAVTLSIIQYIREGKIYFDEAQFVPLIHLFIAFLVYLYMDILKKGKVLQEENDLTI